MTDTPLIRSIHRFLQRAAPAPVYRLLRGAWRRVRPWLPGRLASRRVHDVPGPVHIEDHMMRDFSTAAAADYRRVGLEAYSRMSEALAAHGSNWQRVGRLLDYGAGHARVLRWVRDRQPHVQVTAADVNRQAVRFCVTQFGARGLVVSSAVRQLRLDAAWDVIWVGSVLTHLSEEDCAILLSRLGRALATNGVMLFTTHGELIPARLPEYGAPAQAAAAGIVTAFATGAVCCVPADDRTGVVTFHSREAVREATAAAALRVVRCWPRGWDDHQDVWAVTREHGSP